jgi:hypothetical protein
LQVEPLQEALVRDEGVAGSNPATPTKQNQSLRSAERLAENASATNSATETVQIAKR